MFIMYVHYICIKFTDFIANMYQDEWWDITILWKSEIIFQIKWRKYKTRKAYDTVPLLSCRLVQTAGWMPRLCLWRSQWRSSLLLAAAFFFAAASWAAASWDRRCILVFRRISSVCSLRGDGTNLVFSLSSLGQFVTGRSVLVHIIL
jgi:hypothetical protein